MAQTVLRGGRSFGAHRRRLLDNNTPPFPATTSSLRCLSWQGHGTDLLSDSLAHSGGQPVPKIILNAHGGTGIDVVNLVKNMDPSDESLRATSGIVHMAGSVICLPGACFLWNVRQASDLTVDSLAPILLHRPKLEYLFIGCKDPIPPAMVKEIRTAFQELGASNIVVESMDITNVMGTFNILNGEDRMVAAAIILDEES